MRRRSFVAMLALVSAGCVEGGREATGPAEPTEPAGTDENNTDEDTERDDENTPTGDGSEEAREVVWEIFGHIPPNGSNILAEFGTAGLTASGFFGARQRFSPLAARLVEDGDEESPPRLRTAQANLNDGTEEYELSSLPPYDGVAENENGDVMYAVPTEEHDLAKDTPEVGRDDGAWYLEGEHDRGEWLPTTFELTPETGYFGEYFLVSENGELGEGDYVFEGDESDSVGVGLTVSTWETGSPGPSEESRFETGSLPEAVGNEEVDGSFSFYHDADEKTEAYLKPSKESVELSAQEDAEMEFELTNRSDVVSRTFNARFGLSKLVDGDWVLVDNGPGGVRLGDYVVISPGRKIRRRVRYTQTVPEEEFEHTEPPPAEDYGVHSNTVHTYDATRVVGPTGGGTYAYDMFVSFGDDIPAAVFEVEAPPIEVEPPKDASVEREGGRVVVTVGDEPGSAFVVERADIDEVEVVPSEALYGVEDSLRYAVPFFDDGVDEVRVEADEGTVEDALLSEDERVFEHGGTIYKATKE